MRKRVDAISIICLGVAVSSAILIGVLINDHIEAEKQMLSLLSERASISNVVYTASTLSDEVEPLSGSSETDEIVDTGTADLYNTGLVGDQEVLEVKEGIEVLEIPSLELVAPILDGTDSSSLSVALGHFKDSAKMGEVGNYCVAGHSSSRATYLFNGLHEVELYSEVYLFDSDGNKYLYYVVSKDTVTPSALYITKNTNDRRLTMITCIDSGSMRLCVTALMLTETELRDYKIKNNEARIQSMIDINKLYENIQITQYMSSRIEPKVIYHSMPDFAFESYGHRETIGVFKNDLREIC